MDLGDYPVDIWIATLGVQLYAEDFRFLLTFRKMHGVKETQQTYWDCIDPWARSRNTPEQH